MTKQKTFYQLLKPVILEYVNYYREDFLIHDRSFFRRNPSGNFLMSIRETGTDVVNLDGWDELSDETTPEMRWEGILSEKERSRQTCISWSTTFNKRFFHGVTGPEGRAVTEISKEAAIDLLNSL